MSYQELGLLLPSADVDRLVAATKAAFDQVWGMDMNDLVQRRLRGHGAARQRVQRSAVRHALPDAAELHLPGAHDGDSQRDVYIPGPAL
jgi:hypothetical protein